MVFADFVGVGVGEELAATLVNTLLRHCLAESRAGRMGWDEAGRTDVKLRSLGF